MFFSPIGSWITKFDAAMIAAMDLGISGLCSKALGPMIGLMTFWYIQKAIDISKGQENVVAEIIPKTIYFGASAYLASNPSVYNAYVRDLFFVDLPAYLLPAITSGMQTGTIVIASGVNSIAASFDVVWAQTWQIGSNVWGLAGTFDVGTKISVVVSVFTALCAQAVMAMVYLCTRFGLSIVLELGVVVLMFYPVDACKDMVGKWLGKVISLTFMQLAVVVVLVSLTVMDQFFMDQILNGSPGPGGGVGPGGVTGPLAAVVPGAAIAFQGLLSMTMVFLLGAFAVLIVPAIAYSIGGGVAISTVPILAAAYKALTGGASAVAGAIGHIPSFPTGGGGGSPLSMSLPSGAISSGARSQLTPLAAPALASYGQRSLR